MTDTNQKDGPVVLTPESVTVNADVNSKPTACAANEAPTERPQTGCAVGGPAGSARLEDVVVRNEAKLREVSGALGQLASDASEQLTELRLRLRLLEDVVCAELGLTRVELLTRAGELHLDRVTKAFLGKSDNFPEIEFNPSTTLTGQDILTESL